MIDYKDLYYYTLLQTILDIPVRKFPWCEGFNETWIFKLYECKRAIDNLGNVICKEFQKLCEEAER